VSDPGIGRLNDIISIAIQFQGYIQDLHKQREIYMSKRYFERSPTAIEMVWLEAGQFLFEALELPGVPTEAECEAKRVRGEWFRLSNDEISDLIIELSAGEA
jgi:hypothetical protein